jgi:hypothetical protein
MFATLAWQDNVRRCGNASLLYEMQEESGDKEPSINYAEEQTAGNTGRLPQLWHQGFSYWQGLILQ